MLSAASLPVSLQTERLQALLADNEKVNLSEIEPIPLPLEPQIRIRGIVPETATLFKVQKNKLLIVHFLIFSATAGSLNTGGGSMVFKAPVTLLCFFYDTSFMSLFPLCVSQSALMPAKLIFKAEDGAMYPVIFKHGDDLRQDQLILQIISLMDKVRTLFC